MTTEENKAIDEAEIRRLIDGCAEALGAKDIDGVMSLYAQEIVSFDLEPPLQYVGADQKRKTWEEVFSSFEGQIGYAIHDLDITAGDDMVFTHSLNWVSGTMNNGRRPISGCAGPLASARSTASG